MQSDNGYTFGGYSKIGFKATKYFNEYKIDNKCFLFSINLKRIYPSIRDKANICYIGDSYGLCFNNSLGFYDNFMKRNDNKIHQSIKTYFNGLQQEYEMNGGESKFKIKELEVFQLYKN